MHMFSIFLLVLALSLDTFVASLAYGANRVKVTWMKVLALNLICSGSLGVALKAGAFLDQLVPEGFTRAACVVSLFFLGMIKLLDYSIKKYIRIHHSLHKDLAFSISGVQIIINIYGDPMEADFDHSQSLSWKETIFLSCAMSLDSLVAGALAAFLKIPVWLTMGTSLALGCFMMGVGLFLGKKLAGLVKCDLSWLSGLLFLILSVTKGIS